MWLAILGISRLYIYSMEINMQNVQQKNVLSFRHYKDRTVGRGKYNQRKKFNRWPVRRRFYSSKNIFSTCSFFCHKLQKKYEKICNGGKKMINFFTAPFSLALKKFRRIYHNILIQQASKYPTLLSKPWEGSGRGDVFDLFSLGDVKADFSRNCCARSITNRFHILQQPPPRHCIV